MSHPQTPEEIREYVDAGEPFRTTSGNVYQNFSELSLHNGFWWYDAGCAIAPEGCEQNLPVIDEGPEWIKERLPKGTYTTRTDKDGSV